MFEHVGSDVTLAIVVNVLKKLFSRLIELNTFYEWPFEWRVCYVLEKSRADQNVVPALKELSLFPWRAEIQPEALDTGCSWTDCSVLWCL